MANGRAKRSPRPGEGARAARRRWSGFVAGLDPNAPAEEETAVKAAELFTAYLRQARDDVYALSTLPPGRFLMPGDLEGSPALTFAPLPLDEYVEIVPGSLAAMMARRFEAYKTHVARPFFRDHFCPARPADRAGRRAQRAELRPRRARRPRDARSTSVMHAFRVGRASLLSTLIFRPRIERILFAATKADHLHHVSHDRLEALLKLVTDRAIARADGVRGRDRRRRARRHTRDARSRDAHGGEMLKAIVGDAGGGRDAWAARFSTAPPRRRSFPASCPTIPRRLFEGEAIALPEAENDWRFVRFRPPITRAARRRPTSGSTARCNS